MITKTKKIKRGSSKIILSSVLIIITILAVIGFLAYSNLKINQKRAQLKSQIDSLKKEIQILKEKNEQLKAGISETQSEGYLEKKARESLGLKKPGEEVVVVLPPKEGQENKNKQEKNFWQKILDPVRNFFKF